MFENMDQIRGNAPMIIYARNAMAIELKPKKDSMILIISIG